MSWRSEIACAMLPNKAVGSVGTLGRLGTDGGPLGTESPVGIGRLLVGRPEVGRDTGKDGSTPPSAPVGKGGRLTGREGVPTLGAPMLGALGRFKASAAVASAAKKTRLGRILADGRSRIG